MYDYATPRCPLCGAHHVSDTRYIPTRKGYLALATWRAAEKRGEK